MKRKGNYLVLFLMIIGIASCGDDFLDQTATTDLSEESVFADSAYAAGFLTDIYADIGFDTDLDRFGEGGLQCATDESEPRASSRISSGLAFATGTINPVIVTTDAWEKCYSNIRKCNKFMQRIGDAPMIESAKLQYKAEARFLRAWYYYILLRHYGGVPIVYDKIYGANEPIDATRQSYETCVNYIIDECNAILADNILRPRNSGRSNGRISQAACYALIMRVTLDAASPLHNGSGFGTDDTKLLLGYANADPQRWERAYEAAKRAMQMQGDYRLYEVHTCHKFPDANDGKPEPGWGFYAVQSPGEFVNVTSDGAFSYPFAAYQEIILMKKQEIRITTCQMLDPPSCGGNGAAGYAYYDLAKAFPMIDGKPIGESSYAYNPLQPNQNRDPRFDVSIIYNGSKICNQTDYFYPIYTYKGENSTQDAVYSGTPTGLYTRKMLPRAASGNWWIEPLQSRPLIRFAEVLLSYAEAVNEWKGPDFSETLGDGNTYSALEVLKLIRRRAGIAPGTDGMYGLKAGMTQDEMREAIRNERRIELAFEGFRFFDVRRWMIAEKTENQPMHGLEITRVVDENNKVTYVPREFVVRNHVFRKAMYFWPIPYAEIVKTPALKQNPYYD
ncbi:RagB/SusD family nutrient uptake outer membrane protein [Prevotella sp. E9-3]|uniref:RagB/SusD family nutrient uptake outer membrane protein n=1 Tax=Prevotella sp. E9-3 TaxID=2913621 RepID=UPI001ED9D043|nr:RagB/SusD family nutrient uptake outer membrane protein [Prevotella sp. E9-3]UKK49040.1 RagB/SusD family nutrient uptake outer membrane protein [Prevotella sp. E9-3]